MNEQSTNGEARRKSLLRPTPFASYNSRLPKQPYPSLRISPHEALFFPFRSCSHGAFKFSELASKNAKQALAINPTLYDANLAVGIENYMLSLKSAPIRWILGMAGAGTNKAEGVRLLKLTAERGHYLAPFARLMLAVGELRDGHTQQGKAILFGLSQEFPQNTLYQREVARLH